MIQCNSFQPCPSCDFVKGDRKNKAWRHMCMKLLEPKQKALLPCSFRDDKKTMVYHYRKFC